MTRALPGLAAVALGACTGEQPADLEPCEIGMAVTSDGEAYGTLSEAVTHALTLDGVVDVCPGIHEFEGYLEQAGPGSPAVALDIRGAGMDSTSLVSMGEGSIWAQDASKPNQLSDLTIESARTEWASDDCTASGESDIECDSPFDRDGRAEGAFLLSSTWVLARVRITNNSGFWGGAITIRQPTEAWDAEITFIDSEIIRNEAVDSQGGAVLVDYNDSWGPRGELTLTSINTDWGEGEDDNTPDDIAFASWDGYFHDSLTVHAAYRFDGVADFTCDAVTYTCE